MKYTSMANTIQSILEGRTLTPIIGTDIKDPLDSEEDETPTDVEDDENSKIRLKHHTRRSIRHQNKLKIIDNA